MNCRICANPSDYYLRSTLFKERIPVQYFKCSSCGFVQTEEPHWLDKAYADVITRSDIGILYRNMEFSRIMERFLLYCFPNVGTCLDYGGGYGIFTRIMRDKGFNFKWYDDHCKNLFAESFEGEVKGIYDVITAFEVLEHVADPLPMLIDLASRARVICFSTELCDSITDFENWWYRAELSGQHISFYSKKSLELIAAKTGKKYYTLSDGAIHVLSTFPMDQVFLDSLYHEKQLTKWQKFRAIFQQKPPEPKRETLLNKDHQKILKLINSGN